MTAHPSRRSLKASSDLLPVPSHQKRNESPAKASGTKSGRFHLPVKKQVTTNPSLPILTVRGERVVMDFALARTYGVPTGRFNEAVKRNLKRFPADFSFVVTRQEYEELISQKAISKPGRGGHTKLPRVFTEHGASMAASIPQQRARDRDERVCNSRVCGDSRKARGKCGDFEAARGNRQDARSSRHCPERYLPKAAATAVAAAGSTASADRIYSITDEFRASKNR